MSTFVLVHGGWRGAWVWRRVERLLRNHGHDVFAPTLTGLAERHHVAPDLVSLATHIREVKQLIEYEELRDVVLCGHSYAGMVISGVGEQIANRIAALVYLDAWVPRDGDSIFSMMPPSMVQAVLDSAAPFGGLRCPPLPTALFKLNEADVPWVERLCTPHPIATMQEPIHLSGHWEHVGRRTFLHATGWGPSPFLQFRERAERDARWAVKTIDCGHDAMLDKPGEVANALMDEGMLAQKSLTGRFQC